MRRESASRSTPAVCSTPLSGPPHLVRVRVRVRVGVRVRVRVRARVRPRVRPRVRIRG
jgi:hypothetical protein